MKRLLTLFILGVFMLMTMPSVAAKMTKSTSVRGYSKKNGTYVHTYTARRHYNSSSSHKRKRRK